MPLSSEVTRSNQSLNIPDDSKKFKQPGKKQTKSSWHHSGLLFGLLVVLFKIFHMKYLTSAFSHNDASYGSNPGTHASPLMKPPVFTRMYQVLPSPVVRMLVEDPVAIHYVAGVDVIEMEAFIQGGAVICQLHHLSSKFWALVDHQSVSALVLQKWWLQSSV